MNMPGFTAEFALQQSGHYQTTGTSLSRGASIRLQICRLNPLCLPQQLRWGDQTVRAQVNCSGCANYCTQECQGYPYYYLGRCFSACYGRCCHGIRD